MNAGDRSRLPCDFLGLDHQRRMVRPSLTRQRRGTKRSQPSANPRKKSKNVKNTPCISPTDMLILVSCLRETGINIRVWRSLVSRLNGVQEAAGSSPVTRTKPGTAKRSSRFFCFSSPREPLRSTKPPLGDQGSEAAARRDAVSEASSGDQNLKSRPPSNRSPSQKPPLRKGRWCDSTGGVAAPTLRPQLSRANTSIPPAAPQLSPLYTRGAFFPKGTASLGYLGVPC